MWTQKHGCAIPRLDRLYIAGKGKVWCRDLGLQVKPLEGLTGQLVKNQLATRYRVARIATDGPPIVRGKIDQ